MKDWNPEDPAIEGDVPDILDGFDDVDDVDVDDDLDLDDEDLAVDAVFGAVHDELLGHVRAWREKGEQPADPALPPLPPTVPPPSRPRRRAHLRPVAHGHGPAGRDVFWTVVADEAFRLATDLLVQLTSAIDLSLDLAAAIPDRAGLTLARSLARGLTGNLATARDFEPTEARASLLAFACDGPVDPARTEAARITGRSRILDFSAAMADRLIRELTYSQTPCPAPAPALAESLAREVGLARETQSVLGLVRNGEGIVSINVSDLNLSKVRLHAPDVPVGTLWSDTTVWPPGVGPRIRKVSRRVGRHTYRVDARDV